MKYFLGIVITILIIASISKTNETFFFRYTLVIIPVLAAIAGIKKPRLSEINLYTMRSKWLERQYKKDIRSYNKRLKKKK